MRPEHLRYLVCPGCKRELRPEQVIEDSFGISSGVLCCAGCESAYPVVRHIPRFVPENNYASGFGLQWTIHAKTQHDDYTGIAISEERFFGETRWPRKLEGATILEVGCGSGRFTGPAVGTGAMVVALDYSVAVDANFAANGRSPNVLIVQGDLYNMPFRPGCFDRVFCFGVLQHTPDVDKSFRCLTDVLRGSGTLVLDVYEKLPTFKRLLSTKHWIRPLTRRIPPRVLYPITRAYVKLIWPIARIISLIPRYGRRINWRLLVVDYRGVFPLSEPHLKEWAILDTFDMLSPTYDNPQTVQAVRAWFREAGFVDVEVQHGHNGIEARGVKPPDDASRTGQGHRRS